MVKLTDEERDAVVHYFLRGSDGGRMATVVEAIVARHAAAALNEAADEIEATASKGHADIFELMDGPDRCDHDLDDPCWHKHGDGCGECGMERAARIVRNHTT